MAIPTRMQAPEWLTSGAEITGGLDLLGLRLPVQFIGGNLLDGVTTVTPSVRYVAFRAWLIYRYAQSGLPNDWRDFTKFAGRIEAALVLANLAQDRSIGGLIGTDEALRRLDSESVDLEVSALVKVPASTIYAGPSDQLGVSKSQEDAVPALIHERGMPIAAIVDRRLSGNLLLERAFLNSGTVKATLDELRLLGSETRIDRIPEDERSLLTKVLVPPSALPTERARIGTYASLLRLAEELKTRPSERELFDRACSMERFGDPVLDPTADGWTSYCVRDAIAVTQEAVLAAVMAEILGATDGGLAGVQREAVVGALMGRVEEHDSALRDLELLGPTESISDMSFRDMASRVESRVLTGSIVINGIRRWPSTLVEPVLYRRALTSGAGALSLSPIAWLLASARVGDFVREGGKGAGSLSYQGWRRLGIADVILPELERLDRENPPFREVAAQLAYRTVQQHLQITWSRLQVDLRRDVALLTAEGSRWFSRNKVFYAGRTASRLGQAIGWLDQLGLIDNRGLTVSGKGVLARAVTILATSESE